MQERGIRQWMGAAARRLLSCDQPAIRVEFKSISSPVSFKLMDCDGRNLNLCAGWDVEARNGRLFLGFMSLVWALESRLGIARNLQLQYEP
jgi:hypothetical protein